MTATALSAPALQESETPGVPAVPNADSDARLPEVNLLPQSTRALESEIAHRERLELALRRALAERQRAEEALLVSQKEQADFFTRHIADRIRLENEVRRQNDDLSQMVRFREIFVGILGHDLRNPLSAITTAASLLQKRADSDKVAKPAARILNSAGRMGRMIDQLLDFTRIRLGQDIPIEHTQTDLAEVCRLAVDEFESTGEGHRTELNVVGDSIGLWDVDRLLQLVSNLLDNALTHGTPSQAVTVSVDGTNESIALEVKTAGVVPPEVLPLLFEPFTNGANEKQERSTGLGLGLFISQQIVLAHAGSINVTSSEADGTRFVVRLPRSPPRSESRTEPALRSAGEQA